MKRSGFTLVEMIVVITIILIILTLTIPLYNQMFKGRALKQADTILRAALAQARGYTSNYPGSQACINFWNDGAYAYAGIIQVYAYNNNATPPLQPIKGATYPLPKFVTFSTTAGNITAGNWLYINPEGYLSSYDPPTNASHYSFVAESAFDTAFIYNNSSISSTNPPVGDIVLESNNGNQKYRMYINLDVPSGKVRKSYLINMSQ